MFRPRQLLVSTIIISLLSCNSTDKQNEKVNPPSLTKNTIAAVTKREEVNPDTTAIIEKKQVPFKIKKTQKEVIADSNHQVQTSLENDFKQIEQNFQDFVINTNFDTTILCKEGTEIKLKHSSFLIASTLTDVKGTITLQVKEFYKISDMILARLTTYSNNLILETGGMIYIQATSDGQLCKLKDSSEIEISFPFTEKKDSMLLFSGSWDSQKINWYNPTKQVPKIEDRLEEATFKGNIQKYFTVNSAFEDSLIDRNTNERVLIDFEISETGRASILKIRNNKDEIVKKIITNAFLKMDLWKPAKRNDIAVKSYKTIPVTFIYDEGEANTDSQVYKENFETTFTDTTINDANSSAIRTYIFSTSKLGWINCDRFYKSQKPKIDYYVDCGNYTELDIKLVFHSFKAILGNSVSNPTSRFQNIPDNEAITVVVIKKINNDTFISLTESNTNLKSINNLAFEKVTMDKLKQKLEQLNNAR